MNIRNLFLIAFTAALLFAVSGCEIKNPVDGVKVLVNAPKVSTIVAVDLVDAKTGEQIGITNTRQSRVKIEGAAKGLVVDIVGNSKTELTTGNGILNFALKEDAKPSLTNPINLTLVVEADGYLPTSQPISIVKEGGSSVVIKMVNKSNPPSGVTNKVAAGAAVAGTIQAAITIEAASSGVKGAAVVTLPAGTVAKDRNGVALSGNLTAEVTYFSNRDNAAQAAFPGGFLVNTPSTGRGLFTTAGFASFQLKDGSGRTASTFSGNPVAVSMKVSGETIFPGANRAIQPGDIIPIWSYDEQTGEWKFEKDGMVTGPTDAQGNYSVNFTTTHFSWWNLDWFNGNFCGQGLTVNVTGTFTSLQLRAKRVDTGEYFWYGGYVSSSDPSASLLNAPRNIPTLIEAYDCGGVVGSVQVADLCGGDVNLPVSGTAGTNVTVQVSAYCANNPDVQVRPYVAIYIKDACGWRYGGYMQNGQITFDNLVLGNSYTFGVWYNGNWYEHPYTVTQTNYEYSFEFPADLCGN
jgi:hypothetical protein